MYMGVGELTYCPATRETNGNNSQIYASLKRSVQATYIMCKQAPLFFWVREEKRMQKRHREHNLSVTAYIQAIDQKRATHVSKMPKTLFIYLQWHGICLISSKASPPPHPPAGSKLNNWKWHEKPFWPYPRGIYPESISRAKSLGLTYEVGSEIGRVLSLGVIVQCKQDAWKMPTPSAHEACVE